MEPQLYKQLHETEGRHWWHRSRLRLADDYIRSMGMNGHAKILDVGCGTGGTTTFLETYGAVSGLDREAQALSYVQEKSPSIAIVQGDANQLDTYFKPNTFDLVTFFGVLYHKWIEDDQDLLTRVLRVLKPGGHVLLAEPAFKCLWREHDELDHGKTRYRLADFATMFSNVGFQYCCGRYFNVLSFPACLALALKYRLFRSKATSGEPSELGLPPSWLNSLMMGYMAFEQKALKWLPFGVSVMVVGQKAD